ncbi:TolB family protein [Chloroflexota bacterium]
MKRLLNPALITITIVLSLVVAGCQQQPAPTPSVPMPAPVSTPEPKPVPAPIPEPKPKPAPAPKAPTKIKPPSSPTLISPINLTKAPNLNVKLEWNEPVAAKSYTLRVETGLNLNTTVVHCEDITDSYYGCAEGELDWGTTYVWKVKASNVAGTSEWSESRKFITPVDPAVENKIAFVSTRDNNREIYIMNADGSNQTRLTNNSALDGHPAWIFLKKGIIFATDRDGNNELYVMGIDGSNQKRLFPKPYITDEIMPSWSSNGRWIAFTSVTWPTQKDPVGKMQLYRIDRATNKVIRLTNTSFLEDHANWSPDSKQIVFTSSRSGDHDIYVMNNDGTNQTKLIGNPALDWDPAWSPDGTKIVFVSLRDGNPEIYVANADGSDVTRLTSNEADDIEPAWSPDGTKIVFASKRDGNLEIYVMNADGTNQTRLTNNKADDRQPAW